MNIKDNTSKQIKSIVLLAVIVFQTLYPTAALALADNVTQPEFGAYEEFNTTDMVDLATGDFSYNIPLLNIPSPEGGFQVPLSYHAGIELNEESSWVGLGWNLNPGVMTRNPSMHPDDYTGEQVSTQVTNPGGSGYVKTYPFYTSYYDSQKGKSGHVGILGLVDIGTGKNSYVGIAPLGLTFKDNGASFDAGYLAKGLGTAVSLAFACASGPGAIAYTAASTLSQGYADMQNIHSSVASGGAGNSFVTFTSHTNKGDLFGIWGKKTDYRWYIDNTKSERQYGTLYLGDMPLSQQSDIGDENIRAYNSYPAVEVDADNNGKSDNRARYYNVSSNSSNYVPVTSDMYYNFGSSDYANSYQPSSLSYDNYSVKGPGISGSIKPYRQDMGSLANSSMSSPFCIAFQGTKYLKNEFPLGYKVQFMYQGDYSNSYTFHNMNGSDLSRNSFPYNLDGTQPGGPLHFKASFNNTKINLNYDTYTDELANVYYQYPTVPNHISNEANRGDQSLVNKKLVHGRNIEWFTNQEIYVGTPAFQRGFMDSHIAYDNRAAKATSSPKQIGAFSITNEGGYTYHYSIPVYTQKNLFCSKDGSTTNKVTDNNSYAVAWLLTGITGPDFIDRGTSNIIDDADWGYWVKFEYGKFSSNYTWRNPYQGVSGNSQSFSYQKGEKETYYLNRIATRTHSALFVKNRKKDGKGYYESDGTDELSNPICTKPSESLRLSDIYVVSNADYDRLVATTSPGFGLKTDNQATNTSFANNGDTYKDVLDSMDIVYAAGATNFLNQSQMQKYHFNYSYSLCGNTLNSFETTAGQAPNYSAASGHNSGTALSGKLTLRSIDFLTKNNARIMPGYVFKYGQEQSNSYRTSSGDNPDYDPNKWDGNGIYKSGGASPDPAAIHNCEKKADQWCLTDIITPLGATIHADYERDDYSSINGHALNESPMTYKSTDINGNLLTVDNAYAGETTSLAESIPAGSTIEFDYQPPGSNPRPVIHKSTTAQGIGNNVIYLGASIPANSTIFANVVYITVKKKYGGSIRVKSITTSDETNSYQTKYYYTKDGTESGMTSGVASYEPQSEKGNSFVFYTYYQHPYTPIIYSNVAVVNGDVNTTFNEKSKSTYHFVTPHENMLSVTNNNRFEQDMNTGSTAANYSVLWGNFSTVNSTSSIGSLDTIKTINKFNNVISKTVFEYSNTAPNAVNADMGYYTENTLLWEFLQYQASGPTKWKMRFLQSYILNTPNFLRSITTYKDRLVSKAEYTSFDYLTGQVLATKNTYGGLEKYETVNTPAYTHYDALKSKVVDPANKNIMTAFSETKNYVYDQFNQRKILSASAKTWKSTHYYRDISSTGYNNGSNQIASALPYKNAWLPDRTFNWKSLVQENGTITGFIPYNYTNFGSPDNEKWIQTSGVTLYDRYSHVLESYDINNLYSSVKYGFNQSYVISGSRNARYTDWCSSGAEEKNTTNSYFEGEVEGSTYQYLSPNTYAHTGSYCSRVNLGQTAFKFKLDLPSQHLNKKYKASVWVHENGVQNASLECFAYNGSLHACGAGNSGVGYINSAANVTAEHIGSFYLLTLEVDPLIVPLFSTYLIFQVKSNSNSGAYIYADDFRVHPLNAPITANVFEPKTGRLMATLNADNMAVKFAYDNSGRLSNTYKETKLGFKVASDIRYNYNR